jgi:hypothetical protein
MAGYRVSLSRHDPSIQDAKDSAAEDAVIDMSILS